MVDPFFFLSFFSLTALSGLYCQVMLAGLYPLFIYEVLKKYLQAQAVVLPQMFVAIIANLWSVGANFLFVNTLELGYVGAPIARATTNILLPLLTLAYIVIFKKFEGSWGEHFFFFFFPGSLFHVLTNVHCFVMQMVGVGIRAKSGRSSSHWEFQEC